MTEKQSVSSNCILNVFCNVQMYFIDRTAEVDNIAATVDYFSLSLEYNSKVKILVDNMAEDIENFVQIELDRFNEHRTIPLAIIITLGVMVPIIIYVTYLSTTSMFQ